MYLEAKLASTKNQYTPKINEDLFKWSIMRIGIHWGKMEDVLNFSTVFF